MEEALYTVVKDGKPTGPYHFDELKTLNIKPSTFIKKRGMDDYKEAHELVELREFFGFSYQQVAPQYFASFDQRLVAHLIDYLVLLAGYIVIMLLLYLVLSQNAFRLALIIGLIFLPLAKLIYGSIVEASSKQATIGKRLMDIKVTDTQGYQLTLANSFGRNFGKVISILPLFFGYLYLFLNKRQQCFHDSIADTLVVKQRLI